jgi:LacI family transcriptional regulator
MDDRGAAYEGVRHLHRLGYRRIGFIGGLRGASTSRRRLDGYRAALRAAGLRVEPSLVADGDFRVESGYRAGLELLKHRPDAVFIGNYLMTVGFMEALRQYRLRCPEDVAIVTCDDHPWLDAFSPRLTTIDLPKRELGSAAAQLLVSRIARRRGKPRIVQLTNALRVRESCGCALTTALAR